MREQLSKKIQREIVRITKLSKQRYYHEDAPRIEALRDVLKWMRELDVEEVSECDGAPDWISTQD